MEAICSSETSVLTKNTRRKIPEDGFPHSHRRENSNLTIQFLFIYLQLNDADNNNNNNNNNIINV
jgi:hypothetical protein